MHDVVVLVGLYGFRAKAERSGVVLDELATVFFKAALGIISTQRVHVPNNWVLGGLLMGIVVQVLGKYMIIGYLDP